MRTWAFSIFSLLLSFSLLLISSSLAEQCGRQAGGALCPGGLCCSTYGWCGCTDAYCGVGCQSQCDCTGGNGGDNDIGDLISSSKFDEMLPNRNRFYSYSAFIEAAKSFPGFGTTGNDTTRKRELAAFFSQTSHETRVSSPDAPGDQYAWGYYYVIEENPQSEEGNYSGRGPIQLSGYDRYKQCGKAIGVDLLNNPDLVATDPVISFKSAIWFWMTSQSSKPSCHDVIIENWRPSARDITAKRVPGYGVITNIINGGIECGIGQNQNGENRIGFYKRFCDQLEVDCGTEHLGCYDQKPFGSRLIVNTILTATTKDILDPNF